MFSQTRSRRWLLRASLAVGTSVVTWEIAGCGGDDDDEPTTVATPSPGTLTTPTTGTEPSAADTATPTEPATPTATAEPTVTPEPTRTPTATAEPTPIPSPTPTSTPSPPDKVWEQLQPDGDLPSPRRDHSLTAVDDGSMAYLFGGRGTDGPLGDLWIYDVEANQWIRLEPQGSAPDSRFGHNAAFDPVRGQLLIFGGQAGSDFFNDIWAYNELTNSWQLLSADPAGPQPRYGAASAYDTGTSRFYISHGFTSAGRFDDTWAYSSNANGWADVSPIDGVRPEPRCLVRMGADPATGRLLLFAGQSNSEAFKGDFWSFDIAGQVWEELDIERPSPRNLYSMVDREAEQLVVFGGNSPSGPLNDIWAYDLNAGTWAAVVVDGASPNPRDSHDSTWLTGSGHMLMFGGRTDGGGEVNDLWRLALA